MNIQNILPIYLKTRKNVWGVSDSSIDNYKRYISRLSQYMQYKVNNTDIENITIDLIAWFAEKLRDTEAGTSSKYYLQKSNPKMHPNTVKYHLTSIKAFIERCSYEWYKMVNHKLIKTWRTIRTKIKCLTKEQIKIMIGTPQLFCINELIWMRDKLLFMFWYYCWLRIHEALNIKVQEVLQCDWLLSIIWKWAQNRNIVISDELKKETQKFRDMRKSKTNQKYQSERLFICLDRVKLWKQFWAEWTWWLFRKYEKHRDFWFRPTYHLFRHSHCTHMWEAWIPWYVIQESMWHKNIETTQFYLHASTIKRLEAQDALQL